MSYEKGSRVLVRKDAGGQLADHRLEFGVVMFIAGAITGPDDSPTQAYYMVRLDSATEVTAGHSELLPA